MRIGSSARSARFHHGFTIIQSSLRRTHKVGQLYAATGPRLERVIVIIKRRTNYSKPLLMTASRKFSNPLTFILQCGGSWKMYKFKWKTTHKFIKQPSARPAKHINHQTQPTNLTNRDEGLILCSLRLRCHCHRLPRRSQLSPGRSMFVWYSPVL